MDNPSNMVRLTPHHLAMIHNLTCYVLTRTYKMSVRSLVTGVIKVSTKSFDKDQYVGCFKWSKGEWRLTNSSLSDHPDHANRVIRMWVEQELNVNLLCYGDVRMTYERYFPFHSLRKGE